MKKTNPVDWNIAATRLLKSEMILAGVTYNDLTTRLAEYGIVESYKGVANKINRGTFTFAFFLQCMSCMRINAVQINKSLPASRIENT